MTESKNADAARRNASLALAAMNLAARHYNAIGETDVPIEDRIVSLRRAEAAYRVLARVRAAAEAAEVAS